MACPDISPRAVRYTVTDGLMTVRGRRLRVQVRRPEGMPSGPPLLLINGIGAALDALDPFVAELPADREVIRFDPPGVGGSPAAGLAYHVTTFAPVIGDLITRLGHERADVLGYSWGGQLAQQLAITRPAQVRRLVLVATSTGSLAVPANPRVLLHFLRRRWPQDPAAALAVATELFGGTMRTHPERATAALEAITQSLSLSRRGYAHQLVASVGWTSLLVLPLIQARTLVIAGEDDPIIPIANARILRCGIPDARVHRHPGGHLAIITEAEELALVAAEFLGSTHSPPPGGIAS